MARWLDAPLLGQESRDLLAETVPPPASFEEQRLVAELRRGESSAFEALYRSKVGLLYGLLTGAEVEESARMANAVAALKCRSLGARTALPREGELVEFLQKNV